jgi:hypothetical protein
MGERSCGEQANQRAGDPAGFLLAPAGGSSAKTYASQPKCWELRLLFFAAPFVSELIRRITPRRGGLVLLIPGAAGRGGGGEPQGICRCQRHVAIPPCRLPPQRPTALQQAFVLIIKGTRRRKSKYGPADQRGALPHRSRGQASNDTRKRRRTQRSTAVLRALP